MLKSYTCLLLLLLSIAFQARSGQPDAIDSSGTHVWVFFSDKDGVEFDPYTFFHPKAIDRRIRHGQDLFDKTDFPVRTAYLDTLATLVDSVGIVSRWLNAAVVYASHAAIDSLRHLSFVTQVLRPDIGTYPADYSGRVNGGSWFLPDDLPEEGFVDEGLMADNKHKFSKAQLEHIQHQISHMSGHYFSQQGFNGEQVRMAIFDAGFPGADTHPALAHLHRNNKIIATWDFHRNRENVYGNNPHGTMVLSMIAGQIDSTQLGLAPGAEFLLARTEIRREPLVEEEYWIAAAEWADQHGADIINSSLGYLWHRYFPEQMDGQTSIISRAASVAARKGILIVNAAGNEGLDKQWRIIITPADVDSVLTVGAVELPGLLRASYSSVGPTSDLRRKPNVVALGEVIAANRSGYSKKQGTSFASPLVAGFAACLWQMYPEWTNMQVFQAIEQSASLYPYYDYSHGYGIPQASYFFGHNAKHAGPTFDMTENDGLIRILIRKNPTDTFAETFYNDGYLYYHIRNHNGVITSYYVIEVQQEEVLTFRADMFEPGHILVIHYKGFTLSKTF